MMPILDVPSTLKVLDLHGRSPDVLFFEGGRLDITIGRPEIT